jgi:hypothetical protein
MVVEILNVTGNQSGTSEHTFCSDAIPLPSLCGIKACHVVRRMSAEWVSSSILSNLEQFPILGAKDAEQHIFVPIYTLCTGGLWAQTTSAEAKLLP